MEAGRIKFDILLYKVLSLPDFYLKVFRFKNYIAFFLLLLIMRVLIPETAVLALHNHEHTVEQVKKETGFKLEKKHQHCHIDDVFNSPYTPTQSIVIKAVLIPFTDLYAVSYAFIWKFTFPNNTDLRGPPIA